jgi:hypothetical protein
MNLYGEDNCKYMADGTNPGILHCPSVPWWLAHSYHVISVLYIGERAPEGARACSIIITIIINLTRAALWLRATEPTYLLPSRRTSMGDGNNIGCHEDQGKSQKGARKVCVLTDQEAKSIHRIAYCEW